MAWVRCCGGSTKKNIIYENGSQFEALGATGYSYAGGGGIIEGEYNADNIHLKATTSSAVAGTLNAIDVSNYTTLHFLIKSGSAQATRYGCSATKLIPTSASIHNSSIYTVTSDYIEVAVSTVGLSTAYIWVACTQTNTSECWIKKIWLT